MREAIFISSRFYDERKPCMALIYHTGELRKVMEEDDESLKLYLETPEPKLHTLRGKCVIAGKNTISDKSALDSLIEESLRIPNQNIICVNPRPDYEVDCLCTGTIASKENLQLLKISIERNDLRLTTRLKEILIKYSQFQGWSVDIKKCARFLLSTTSMQNLIREQKHTKIYRILLRNLKCTWKGNSGDGVRECLRKLYRQARKSSNNTYRLKTVGKRREEFRWTIQEQYGFLWNRLITLSGKKAGLHSSGIEVLGGTLPALEFAWTTFFDAAARYMKKRELGPLYICSNGTSVAGWTRLLADALNIEIIREETGHLPAFLIQTASKRRIYASKDLEPRELSMAVLHEIAHLVLNHRPANECGLAYETLSARDASEFDQQEKVADTMAILWEHIFLGLDFLVNELQGEQNKGDSWGLEQPPASKTGCSRIYENRHPQDRSTFAQYSEIHESFRNRGNCRPRPALRQQASPML